MVLLRTYENFSCIWFVMVIPESHERIMKFQARKCMNVFFGLSIQDSSAIRFLEKENVFFYFMGDMVARITRRRSAARGLYQGHPWDRLGKISVWKAFNPL